MNIATPSTHSLVIGYILWGIGFFGTHRFYYGKKLSGLIYLFTFGIFFIGWIIDIFLIPSMHAETDQQYAPGSVDYSIAWLLLIFTGILGLHRLYMRKWGTALIFFFTFGLFGFGYIYDIWTLNEQISMINSRRGGRRNTLSFA